MTNNHRWIADMQAPNGPVCPQKLILLSWWDDCAGESHIDKGAATELMNTMGQLGSVVPVDSLRWVLPNRLKWLADEVEGQSVAPWLLLLHSCGWQRVPGINLQRWMWERSQGRAKRAFTIAEEAPVGAWHIDEVKKHRPELEISSDWISELFTPLAVASLIAIDWLQRLDLAEVGESDDDKTTPSNDGAEASTEEASFEDLRPGEQRAWMAWVYAEKALGDRPRLQEAFEWIVKNQILDYQEDEFKSWTRQRSSAAKRLNVRPLKGKGQGGVTRSIVSPSEI